MNQDPDRAFFGHPKGLGYLAGTELWERFSFYGMQTLLMLYLTQYLLKPEHEGAVLGLTEFRRLLSSLFGPMSDLGFASQIFGLYSALIYVTPLFGAWLADRVIGARRTVTTGAVLMIIGHITMASERLFLLALALLILGSGCVTGNMAAQVGRLYGAHDERRPRAFGLYLAALNLGLLLSPMVVGTLGEIYGWHWGFGSAGIGMAIGLLTYLAGRKYLPPDRASKRETPVRLTRRNRRSIFAILLILIPYALAMAALLQAYGLMLVWAEQHVDRQVFGWKIPVTWVLSFDGVTTIVLILLTTSIWKRLAARGREPGDVAKLGIGCAFTAAAYLYISIVAHMPSVPLLLWFCTYLILDFAIAWIEAPTASLVSGNAPSSVNATMMSIFKLARAVSYLVMGFLGGLLEVLGGPLYWAMTGGLAAVACVYVLIFGRRLSTMLANGSEHQSVEHDGRLEKALAVEGES